jgi:hypothetical protein
MLSEPGSWSNTTPGMVVELPVLVAEQFSWYICFGIIINLS